MSAPDRTHRRDAAATRDALLVAARTLLAEHGVAQTTTREIAAAVGVNQALINRYFGSKENLFIEALRSGSNRVDTLIESAPLDEVPDRLLREVLEVTVSGRSTTALLASVVNYDSLSGVVRDMVDDTFSHRFAARLDGPDAALRAELLNALVAGIATMREKIGTPALVDADLDRISEYVERMARPLLDGN